MVMFRRCALLLLAAWAGLTSFVAAAEAPAPVKALEARDAAIEAYIYAYPLVTMEMTRRVMTNVAAPVGTRARWAVRPDARIPSAKFRTSRPERGHALHDRVAGRNQGAVDRQHSGHEGTLLPVPDARRLDQRVPGPGQAHDGHGSAEVRHYGPGWKGTLPKGVTEYKSPTGIVWILGRIYCTGTPEDYKAVHALQDQVSVVPLSAYGKPYRPAQGKADPSIDMKTRFVSRSTSSTAPPTSSCSPNS